LCLLPGDGPPRQAGWPIPLKPTDHQPFERGDPRLWSRGAMSTSSAVRPDVWLLFATRVVRLFAYGFLSVILVLYLAEVGLREEQIGLLLTMTLLGDTVMSLWITTSADRIGRRRMLLAGAGLMV